MPFDAEHFTPAKVDPTALTTPRERLMYLRDFLRDTIQPTAFSMANWPFNPQAEGHAECGTPMCIGGWTNALFGDGERYRNVDTAGDLLGLSLAEGEDLFYPSGHTDPKFATPAQAANVLTHLLETGEVDWSKA